MKIFTVLVFFVASSDYCHGRTVATESGTKEQRDLKYFGYESNAPLQSLQIPKTDVPVLMYFADYNAFLVPAESISSDMPASKRRKPVANLIKIIQSKVKEEYQENTTFPEIPQKVDSGNGTNVTDTKIVEGHTFGQRPNRPIFQNIVYRPPQIFPQYFPNLYNYFQNREPIKFPFSGMFNPRLEPVEYTRTPTSEVYYYNSFHKIPDYTQRDVSDYVTEVQDSIMREHEDAFKQADNTDSPVMLASVPVGKDKATSLVLRPVAKAVAGPKGVAVASPVAKAVLRRGEMVDIDFDPDAVAIAGPGGEAHSHPKLIISYMNDTKAE